MKLTLTVEVNDDVNPNVDTDIIAALNAVRFKLDPLLGVKQIRLERSWDSWDDK
jgi:hypothetical protein